MVYLNSKSEIISHKLTMAVCFILICLPLLSLAINLISWLKFGMDFPFMDDMRAYASGNPGRMDWDTISKPANDTLYPVGIILDALSFRFLGGNAVAYQAVSMISVLGLLLFLQWRLLSLFSTSYTVKCIAFACTIFMLQPDSYWGFQNMAYHQAIPLICSLAIVLIVLSSLGSAITAFLVFSIAFVSGFTYISGAFANFSILLVFLMLWMLLEKDAINRVRLGAISIIIPAIVTLLAQLWVIVFVQHGTHRSDAPMAYPWESDFWYFMLGKLGRSLVLPVEFPELSFAISLSLLLLCVSLSLIAVFEVRRNRAGSKLWNLSVAFLCLFGVIIVYLSIVSAGRANLRPETLSTALQIFASGFERFHFFWACVLWPLAVAFIAELLRARSLVKLESPVAPIFVLVVLSIVIYYSNLFNHSDVYTRSRDIRVNILKCLNAGVSRGIEFVCPELNPRVNMLNVFYNNLNDGASYTYLVSVRPTAVGNDNPRPIYRLTDSPSRIKYINSSPVIDPVNGVQLINQVDPMLILSLEDESALRECNLLEVNGTYEVASADLMQLFYLPAGVKGFNQKNSSNLGIDKGRGDFFFRVYSGNGFGNEIRLDPVVGDKSISIRQLEVRCLSSGLVGNKK